MRRLKEDSLATSLFSIDLEPRQKVLLKAVLTFALLLILVVGGHLVDPELLSTRLEERNEPPSKEHLFGTDWLGRDMLARTLAGLSTSFQVGFVASLTSTLIALGAGWAVAMGERKSDRFITWLIDLFLSLPHLVTLILISFVWGGGMGGVILGVALTHWPSLARVIRAEVLQLKRADFVQISIHLGKSRWWIASRHLFPHLWPQLLVGWLLLFPHAILHEAALTFIGLGLPPHQPAIGVILAESMAYLAAGMWWLPLFPGFCLILLVRTLDRLARYIRFLWEPHAHGKRGNW